MRRHRGQSPRGRLDYGPALAEAIEQMRVRGATKKALQIGRSRLLLAGALFLFGFTILAVRLVEVAVLKPDYEPRAAAYSSDHYVSTRADIVDRNGHLLATNLPMASLYADPARVLNVEEAVQKLVTVLPELDPDVLRHRLASERRFIWIKRHLTPKQKYEVNRLGLPGLAFLDGERRVYPHGALLAHLIGYTGVDNLGLAGIERGLDARLTPTGPSAPEALALSIDLGVQHVVHEELRRTMAEFNALGGAGLVLDVGTGEILALVSLPDFDPNLPGIPEGEARFNRTTLGIYEMGSTFKAFTAAMALDSGAAGLTDGYDASQPIAISRFRITDFHPQNRWLSVPEIILYSSNIGAAKMALDVGAERQQDYLHRFGLLTPAVIELPEVGAPMAPATWRDVNTMTIGFGHGIAVSPLQLASGIAALVNGGIMRPATLLKRDGDEPVGGTRVIRAQVSDHMRALLRLVVQGGTGKNAEAPGYLVGGKTGTAEKAALGGYDRKALLSTFVGAFPMTEPRYVVLVSVDEPHGNASTFGYATAGWTAAPTVSRIISRIAPLLRIAPVERPGAPESENFIVVFEEGRIKLAAF
jgi:cell division protein FtsI (penicillin-binding protein 3)